MKIKTEIFSKIVINDKLIKYDMPNEDLIAFLNLPSDIKIFNSFDCYNKRFSVDKNEMCVFRYLDFNFRYLVRVGFFNKFGSFIMHNPFGYAWICFKEDNIYFSRFINNVHHSINKSSYKRYYKGKVIEEWYKKNGIFHSSVGPAKRYLFNNKWQNDFYNYGKKITLEQFCNNYEKRIKI